MICREVRISCIYLQRMWHIFPACPQYCCDKNLYWLQNRDAQSVSTQLCSLLDRVARGQLFHTVCACPCFIPLYAIIQRRGTSEFSFQLNHRRVYCFVAFEDKYFLIGRHTEDHLLPSIFATLSATSTCIGHFSRKLLNQLKWKLKQQSQCTVGEGSNS